MRLFNVRQINFVHDEFVKPFNRYMHALARQVQSRKKDAQNQSDCLRTADGSGDLFREIRKIHLFEWNILLFPIAKRKTGEEQEESAQSNWDAGI